MPEEYKQKFHKGIKYLPHIDLELEREAWGTVSNETEENNNKMTIFLLGNYFGDNNANQILTNDF